MVYRGLPIYTEEKDLCDRTKCPVQPGPLSLKYDQYLPPIAPPVSAAAQCALCGCHGLQCSICVILFLYSWWAHPKIVYSAQAGALAAM